MKTTPIHVDPTASQIEKALANLVPCPFCGTKRLRLHEWMFGAYIHCECGAKGPYGWGSNAKLMALDLWNQRQTSGGSK